METDYLGDNISFSRDLKSNEIIFHFSGLATVYFNDTVLETKPNSIRFLPRGKASKYDVQLHERGECIDVFFQTDSPISSEALVIAASQNEKLGMLFKKLFAAWVGKGDGYYFESLSILYKIFAELQNDNYVPRSHYARIKPAIDRIRDRFLSEELSISELATACGIKESYFLRLFKEKFGISPKKYIIQLKINHACELLRLQRYSVTQIAEMCGFSDVYFFSRQFKQYMGITPTEFIKKYRSQS